MVLVLLLETHATAGFRTVQERFGGSFGLVALVYLLRSGRLISSTDLVGGGLPGMGPDLPTMPAVSPEL